MKVVASSEMNFLLRTGQPIVDLHETIIAVVLFVVAFATGPLFMFVGKLREAKSKGIFEYGDSDERWQSNSSENGSSSRRKSLVNNGN